METKAEVIEIVKNIGSVFQLKNYPEEDLYLEVFLSFKRKVNVIYGML